MIPESVIHIGEQPDSTSEESPKRKKEPDSPKREKNPKSHGSKKRPVIRSSGMEINDVKIEMDPKCFSGVIKLLEEIFSLVFGFYASLHEIYLRHKDPLDFSDAFSSVNKVLEITLYVPKGTGEAYRNCEHYKDFKEIIEE